MDIQGRQHGDWHQLARYEPEVSLVIVLSMYFRANICTGSQFRKAGGLTQTPTSEDIERFFAEPGQGPCKGDNGNTLMVKEDGR